MKHPRTEFGVQKLVGISLPAVNLVATSGLVIDLPQLQGISIIFCYPYTGRPGYPNPRGWDDIPGAHGSTPQALAYSKLYPEFRKLGVSIFGLSIQDTEWQRDFVERNALGFALLSDADRKFSQALGLPTFRAGDEEFLRRLTMVVENGVPTMIRYPVEKPEKDAEEVLQLLLDGRSRH